MKNNCTHVYILWTGIKLRRKHKIKYTQLNCLYYLLFIIVYSYIDVKKVLTHLKYI